MNKNFICAFALLMLTAGGVSAQEPSPKPNPDLDKGWKSHDEYHRALRLHLLENDDKETVDKVDAAMKILVPQKRWAEIWELTQKSENVLSTVSWYAASSIAKMGSEAKEFLPLMTKTLMEKTDGREQEWPRESAGVYVGLYAYDIYAAIGRPSLPYLIPRLSPAYMVFCKDGQTYELDAKSWANRRSNEIAIYYDYRRSITADTVDAILNKKPFVYYVEKELIDPNSIQITRDNFNSTFARRAARKVLRRLMKEQDISIRIRTIFVALRDPVLLIDAGVCMAGVAGDAMEMMRLAVQNRQPARRK